MKPSPEASFTLNTEICGGVNPITNTSQRANSYAWTVTNTAGGAASLSSSIAETPNLTFPANTTTNVIEYRITLDVSSGSSCKDSKTDTVKVYPEPTMTISGDVADACTTKNLNLNSSSSNANGGQSFAKRQWLVDGIERSTNPNFNHTLSNTGTTNQTFRITLIGTTDEGCVDSTFEKITIFPEPKAEFTATKIEACAAFTIDNSLITLTPYPDANGTYEWKVLDAAGTVLANSNTQTPPSHTINAANTSVIYRLITTSGKGCGKDSTEVTFKTFPDPVPNFTPDKTGVCPGEEITFANNSTLAGGGTTRFSF